MGKTCKNYSIWLMPRKSVYSALSSIISKLSTDYKTPFFQPHITLLKDLTGKKEDLISKTRQLASEIHPFIINPLKPSIQNKYFKSLFLKVEETKEVINTNLKAQEIFGIKEKYFPHLSLMYGNVPTIKKIDIISSLEKINLEFPVKSLYLYSTKGSVKDWHEIKEIPLIK